jgi:hypothetical protein
MTYNLYYKNHFIAHINEIDSDFPNTFGTYELQSLDLTNQELKLVSDYINYSTEVYKLIDESDKYDQMVEQEEWKYETLIESEDWTLETEQGKKITIMVPNFIENQEVIWRYA